MGSRQLNNWLLSAKGRRALAASSGIIACGTGCLHYMPNTFLLKQYQGFVQMYKSGVEVPVNEEILKTAESVLEECSLTTKEKGYYSFFTAFGFDLFHAGSTKFWTGIKIGIPYSFNYKSTEDIDTKTLLVNRETFNFNSPVGQSLLNSLILSERALKFAIAREIHAATTYYVHAYSAAAAGAVLVTHSLSSIINTRFNFLRAPRSIRFTLYGFTCSIGLLMYCMVKDALNNYYDKSSDLAACQMGKDYVLGGVEYYEKLLQRNQALRHAMGAEGRRMYTLFGNRESWIRTKNLPITAHLDLVKDLLVEMENALGDSNAPMQT